MFTAWTFFYHPALCETEFLQDKEKMCEAQKTAHMNITTPEFLFHVSLSEKKKKLRCETHFWQQILHDLT